LKSPASGYARATAAPRPLPENESDRGSESLLSPAIGFLTIGVTIFLPGLLMLIFGHSWVFALGIAMIVISAPFGTGGIAGLGSTLAARWTGRHRSFA
jgi:hypothetical protein